jgi:MFS family permease
VLRRPDPDSLWADPDWRRYWTSRVVSYAGGTITYVAAPILVYALTSSALLTGVTAATEGLPYLLFGLLAGALSDRIDRRRVMVTCDLLNAVVLATVPVAAAFGRLTAAHVIATGFVAMTVFVFFDSANFGAVPTLVGRERIAAANAAVWGTTQVVDVVLPGVVGLLVAVVAPSSLYWVDAFTFLASAALLRSIRGAMTGDRSSVTGRVRDDILTGVRWLWAHPTLRTMTFVGTATSFAFGGMIGQLVPFADQVIGIGKGDARLGAVFACFSLGGVVGTFTHRLVRPYSPARISLVAMTALAVLIVALPWVRDWRGTLVVVFLIGVADLVAVVNVINFRQEETPEDMQGRVNTTGRMLSWGLGGPVGALLCGVVAGVAGPAAGVRVAGGVLAVCTAAAWMSSLGRVPARRNLVPDAA